MVAAEERILSDKLAMPIIQLAADNFWGNAVGANGEILKAPPNTDPSKPIIPKETALNVVESSIPVAQAMVCESNWQPYYLSYMAEQRKKEWREEQIAFIGLLFGVSQQQIANVLRGSCTSDKRRVLIENYGFQAINTE